MTNPVGSLRCQLSLTENSRSARFRSNAKLTLGMQESCTSPFSELRPLFLVRGIRKQIPLRAYARDESSDIESAISVEPKW
jgi:hypothetical protein